MHPYGWEGLHSTRYPSAAWHLLRLLANYVLARAMKAAVSTLSCFNHRGKAAVTSQVDREAV